MKTLLMFFAIFIWIFAISCSESLQENAPAPNSLTDMPEIAFENNMLVLNSSEILGQILSNEKQISNVSFISKQNVIDQVIKEEQLHAMSLRNLSDEEYEKAEKHSALYKELLEKKVIKVEKFSDGTELYSLNLAVPNYAKLLNEEGFFAIQDTIFQITSDKMKLWINGDKNNYSYLSTKENTDLSKKIYVYDYSYKTNPLTRSIPKIDRRDQKVAYCTYHHSRNARAIVSFYDQTSLNIPAQGYNRDVYLRYSYQEKIDGRNFSFVQAPYNVGVECHFTNKSENFLQTVNGTGSDDWYTVYFNYDFLNSGKQIQTITSEEDYYSVNYIFSAAHTFADNNDKYIFLSFWGRPNNSTEKMFMYTSVSSERLTPMLPE